MKNTQDTLAERSFLIYLYVLITEEIDLKNATDEELSNLECAASNIIVDIRREERKRKK